MIVGLKRLDKEDLKKGPYGTPSLALPLGGSEIQGVTSLLWLNYLSH